MLLNILTGSKARWEMKNKRAVLVLLLVSGIVYANSLFSGFVWSDKPLIIDKQGFFHNARNALVVLTSPDMGLGDEHATPYYRPLNTLTYMLDSHLWGLDPFWYHLENVLLHVLVTLLFYLLLADVFEDRRLAFFSALMFAVYPVNAEAVNAVFNRNALLCALFSIACLICLKRGSPRWTAASFLFYCLALLSKEPAVILPFFLISFGLAGGFKKENFRAKKGIVAGFFLITAVYFIIRRLVLGAFTSKAGISISPERLKLVASVYFEHFRLMLFPFELNANYTAQSIPFNWIKAAGAVLGVILLLYFSLSRKTPGPARAGAQWIFWGLLPVSNLIKIPSAPVAEKYQYTIILGFCLVLGYIISRLHKRNAAAASAVVMVLALGLGVRTFERNFVWKNDMTLYSSMISEDPLNARAHCNLGNDYAGMGDLDDAVRELRTALSINPGLARAWVDLGIIYCGRGLLFDSEQQLKTAIALDPGLAEAHLDLAVTYNKEGRLPDSIRQLKTAIAIYPSFSEAHLDLGIAYEEEGRLNEAIREYSMAARLDPGLTKAYLLLGLGYQKAGYPEKAYGALQKALELDPGNPQAAAALDRIEERTKNGAPG